MTSRYTSLNWVSAAGALALLSACQTSMIHKTDEFDATKGVQTLAIDARQRVVIFAKGKDDDVSTNITCAEPSPDALSALSTTITGSIQDPKVAANFALAQAESAASIGLRTQSIQLLRDGMYRLCEGFAAHALTAEEFNREQRRYQNLMLSLLAIEQLTGAVVPREVGLGAGSATASVGDKADLAASAVAKANSDVASAQTALKKAQDTQAADVKACTASGDSTTASCSKATEDTTAVDTAQKALDKTKETQTTAEQVLMAARAAVKADAAGALVHFSDAPHTTSITDASARFVAEATRTIVSTTLIASFAQEECSRLWDFVNPQGGNPKSTFKAYSDFGLDKTQIDSLISTCQESQSALVKRASLFEPQYGSASTGPLQVLGAAAPLVLAVGGKPLSYFIVGGVPPYRVSDIPNELVKEIQWQIEQANGNYRLQIARQPGSTQATKTDLFVLDANNAHVDIPITLSAPAPVTPKTPSAKAPSAPTDVVGKSSGSEIRVSFTAPKDDGGGPLEKYTATASNTKTGTKATPLTASSKDGKTTDIAISNCIVSESYSVQVVAIRGGTTSKPGKTSQDVPCAN